MTARPVMYGDHYRACRVEVNTPCALCERLVRRGSSAWEHVRSTSPRVVCGRCVEDAMREERRDLAAAAAPAPEPQLGLDW